MNDLVGQVSKGLKLRKPISHTCLRLEGVPQELLPALGLYHEIRIHIRLLVHLFRDIVHS